jgi:hypothetical protein
LTLSRVSCLLILAAGIHFLPAAMPAFAQQRLEVPVPREILQQIANVPQHEIQPRAEMVDLNNDGKPELIVRGYCAVVGNCSTWIFRRRSGAYQSLLNDDAQLVRIGRAGSHGYRDVVFKVHGSAYESNFLTYRFDGEQYHLKECLYRNYSYIDKKGRLHERKRPQIARC